MLAYSIKCLERNAIAIEDQIMPKSTKKAMQTIDTRASEKE